MFALVAVGGTSIRRRGACWSVGWPAGARDLDRQLVRPGRCLEDGDDEAPAVRRRQARDVDLAEDADGADLAVLRGEGVVAHEEGVELDVGHGRSLRRAEREPMPTSASSTSGTQLVAADPRAGVDEPPTSLRSRRR